MTKRMSNQRDFFVASLKRGIQNSLYCLLAVSAVTFSLPVGATTPKPMTLAEVKQASGSVILGRVTNLQVKVIGQSLNPDYDQHKKGLPPAIGAMNQTGEAERAEEEKDHVLADGGYHTGLGHHDHTHDTAHSMIAFDPTASTGAIPENEMPQSVGTEGGLMLLTEVSMSAESVIGSRNTIGLDGQLQFTVAGGVLDDFAVIVHGMPDLQSGQRYIVFLHSQLQGRGDPYVGLGQGVFPVVFDPKTGRDIVTNMSGCPVIGIEKGQVIIRASDEDRQEFDAMRSPPPTPHNKNDSIQSSVQRSRFWSSKEPALDPNQFMKLVEGL